jgi:3-oxoacyl-[acyl-carrier-protein] synthase III
VLQRSSDTTRGVIYSSLHADGSGWEMLCCKPAAGSHRGVAGRDRDQYMKLKGREVYKFASRGSRS